MATINDKGQSYLEIQGQAARKEQLGLRDYNKGDNEYSEKHSDALADGDRQGKGTGNFSGHRHWAPYISSVRNEFNYSNFNTSDGGNDCDQQARKVMTAYSLYGPQNQYGIDIIPDTSLNVSDGQYDGSQNSKLTWKCPI